MSHGDHTNPFEEESENMPLLSAPSDPAHNYSEQTTPSGRDVGQEERVVDSAQRTYQGTTETYQAESSQSGEGAPSISHGHGGPTVTCRVCEAEISLDGRTGQHVVRCSQCNEATPIRAAPPGKKYVRCPCNCLLVCKAASNRIACPRANCRRVITLGASAPVGTAIRAPAGTCRVQCAYCTEVFMFNTLVNSVANCPHCKKTSSVGARYARSRTLLYFAAALIALICSIGFTIGTVHSGGIVVYIVWVLSYAGTIFLFYRFVYFATLKISQVLGPI
ncbi:transmembrane protein 55A [Aphelenchoides avenae]|nr:transmembrane protein 55A [Aphelenchus avenae]